MRIHWRNPFRKDPPLPLSAYEFYPPGSWMTIDFVAPDKMMVRSHIHSAQMAFTATTNEFQLIPGDSMQYTLEDVIEGSRIAVPSVSPDAIECIFISITPIASMRRLGAKRQTFRIRPKL